MALILVVACFPFFASALDISSRYRSPRNPERKVRQSTELIVLHTTEAPARSSLNKLSDRGEAHFCVTEEGGVYRIVDRDREAFHAGRSMWNGREDVDKFSIGIECVGYHDKPMSTVQIRAIRDLVKELQTMYRVPDERVVCHRHVAYGTPNKWQKRRHRGRKRCGMLFAMPSVRRMLELRYRPAFDPDTRAHRLAIGDDYLEKVLYGGIDTMRASYVVKPPVASKSTPSKVVMAKPAPPKAVAAKPTAKKASAPKKPAVVRTASGSVPKSVDELTARGYVRKGLVSKANSASRIAGDKWNAADTYYTIRDKVIPGTQIDAAHIEKGMSVWMKE